MALSQLVHQHLQPRLRARRLSDDTLEAVLVPLDGLGLVDAVGSTNLGLCAATAGDTLTRAGPKGLSVF